MYVAANETDLFGDRAATLRYFPRDVTWCIIESRDITLVRMRYGTLFFPFFEC